MTASQDNSVTRLPSLTGARAIAAFLVFLNHAAYLFVFADAAVQGGFQRVGEYMGALGVGFFFVLSGFVLTWSARPSLSARRFWRGRVVKIFPNHLVVFAVALGLLFLSGVPIQAAEAVANLFLVQGFVPSQDYLLMAVNGVTWSLSSELLFYALFPLLILAVRKVRPERLWGWAIGSAGLALLIPVAAGLLPSTPPDLIVPGMSWPQTWLTYYFPLARLAEFLVGMFVARLIQEGRWIRLGVTPAALLLTAVYVASLWAPPAYRNAAAYVVPVALLIGAIATSDVKGRQGLLQSRPMIFLGEISFAFFVVHLIVLQAVRGATLGQWPGYGIGFPVPGWNTAVGILFLLGELVLAGFVAWLLHRFVEMPAMRRWARPKPVAEPIPLQVSPPGTARAA